MYSSAQPNWRSKSSIIACASFSICCRSQSLIILSEKNPANFARSFSIGSEEAAFIASVIICLIIFFTRSFEDFALSSPVLHASAYACAKSSIAAFRSSPKMTSIAFSLLPAITLSISSICCSHSSILPQSVFFLSFSSAI